MDKGTDKYAPFVIAVSAAVLTTVIIIVAVAFRSSQTVSFCASYYFVCYRTEDNAVSASSISGAVSDYGGAGYILEYKGKYYVTVACYYGENEAQTVCSSLEKRDLDCKVLCVETDEYLLKSFSAKVNAELYIGNLNTLDSLSRLAYDCANGLDTGSYDQTAAKKILDDVYGGLKGLKNSNAENCFSDELERLIFLCEDVKDGYVYSKDVRKLQIAITDTVINTELY